MKILENKIYPLYEYERADSYSACQPEMQMFRRQRINVLKLNFLNNTAF